DPDGRGLTAAQMVRRLEEAPSEFELLRSALLELCPAGHGKLPSPRSVGNKLRHLRSRVVGGKALDKREQHGTAFWLVVNAPGQGVPDNRGCSGGSGCSETPASGALHSATEGF